MNRLIHFGKTLTLLSIIFFSTTLFSQTKNDTLIGQIHGQNTQLLIKAAEFLFQSQNDSANITVQQIDTSIYQDKDLSWKKAIGAFNRIVKSNSIDYRDQYLLLEFTGNRTTFNKELEVEYVKNVLPEPSTSEGVNFDYVKLLTEHISHLRNQVTVEEATLANDKFKAYISQFPEDDILVKKAKGRFLIHDIVLSLIQQNAKLGFELCNELATVGDETQDPFLMAAAKYHIMDFLVATGDLQGYIKSGEEALVIINKYDEAAQFLLPTSTNLINAYIHKGGDDKRVAELLATVEQFGNTKHLTYYLYAQYIKSLDETSPLRQEIFEKFGASNLVEFAINLSAKAEEELRNKNLIDYYNQLAQAMLKFNQPQLAYKYMQRVADINQKIYSEDLSRSIAKVETENAVKAKEQEIQNERERSQLTMMIAGLSIALLLVFIVVFFRIRKQNKLLEQKNTEIAEQRDNIAKSEQEKAMLLKEVHHRVKNNFQIISSLLELQSKGIEDEKALELAQEGKNRVQSMAFIHQRLYQNDDLLIDFDEYVDKLVKELINMYGVERSIATQLQLKGHSFDIDTAIPLGLIINELVTNAMKYGFSEDEKALRIQLEKQADESYVLSVSDNGKGLPNNIDLKKAKSLGLRLVRRLAKQLHGGVEYTNQNGCTFNIHFKDTMTRALVD